MTTIQTTNLSLAADYLDVLKKYAWLEGISPHLYLDSEGYVTIGLGHLLENADAAKKLPLQDPKTRTNAEAAIIEKAYGWVKMQKAGQAYKLYFDEKNNNLTLKNDEIDKIAIKDIQGKITLLQNKFGADTFDKLPRNAQRSLLDIWFNVKRPQQFVNLIQAVKDSDWSQAAYHSHRKADKTHRGTYARNTLVAVWFCQLAETAASNKENNKQNNDIKKESFAEKLTKEIQASGWATLEALMADLEMYQKKMSEEQNRSLLNKLESLDQVYSKHEG